MTLTERIKEIVAKDSLVYSKPDNLFLFLSTALGKKQEVIQTEFKKLLASGDIFEVRNGKFITIPSHGYVKGHFMGSAKGYAFCDIGEAEDIFIPGNRANGAIDGDDVIIKLFAQEGGKEGEVVKVVKPVKKIVGTVVKVSRNLFLEPDNQKISFKIPILKTAIKPMLNQKVVVRLVRRDNGKISGEVVEILGNENDIKVLEKAIIRSHNLYEEFDDEIEEIANKLNKPVSAKQKKGREDFTKLTTFTIDGEDAKDFDDAVSIKKLLDGYELGVHIADVGEFVKVGSPLDEVAYERATSTYFPTSVLPMLPVGLSNGICSLNEGVERLTLSCVMHVTKDGEVKGHKIVESVIKSRARLTYTEVFAVIEGRPTTKKAQGLKKEIMLMAELAKTLENNRVKRGALDLDIPEPQFVFDDKGYVVDVKKRERNDAHKLIEEFMVLANETVAKHFSIAGVPFVYRVHEKPTIEKSKAVLSFLAGLGVSCPSLPKVVSPKYVQSLLDLIKGKTYEEAANKIILRSMQKAVYKNENLGHFGLALENYCHFTSPIRRYPDLTIHRIIKEVLHKKLTKSRKEELDEFTMESADQSSLQERNSEKAEREVDDLWRAYLMKDRIGEVFDATITSVTNYGVFVGLENSVEGLVKIEDLPQDAYLFFERSMEIKGQKHAFRIGDKMRVKLVNVNLFTRKVDFVPEK